VDPTWIIGVFLSKIPIYATPLPPLPFFSSLNLKGLLEGWKKYQLHKEFPDHLHESKTYSSWGLQATLLSLDVDQPACSCLTMTLWHQRETGFTTWLVRSILPSSQCQQRLKIPTLRNSKSLASLPPPARGSSLELQCPILGSFTLKRHTAHGYSGMCQGSSQQVRHPELSPCSLQVDTNSLSNEGHQKSSHQRRGFVKDSWRSNSWVCTLGLQWYYWFNLSEPQSSHL
jgi:hypothetical protein